MGSRPLGLTSLVQVQGILSDIADWMYTFALTIGVIMIIWGGFLYFTGAEKPEHLEKAKKTLVYGVIGLVVAILATGVPIAISKLLGV